jgi:ribosomal protein S12 methylthiotransferase accessory factor
VRSPSAALAAASRTARRCGTTRLADITGLDWIGVPVFQAVRPWSRALSVHQGKGFTAEAAQIGALMEAIESHCAETYDPPQVCAAHAELREDERALDPTDFSADRADPPGPEERQRWAPAARLTDSGRLWVPVDVVSLDFTRGGDRRLERSSNGLGAHLTWEAAAMAAVLELIERDAVSLWGKRDFIRRSLSQLDLDDIPFAWFADLAQRIARGGVVITVYVLPAVIRTPAFLCELTDPEPSRPCSKVYGSACHPCAEAALAGAVLEAVQSRLTYISGARDDYSRFGMAPAASFGLGAPLPPGIRGLAWPGAPPSDAPPVEAKISSIVLALERAGYRQTAAIDLTPPDSEVFVVKAVSPGLVAFGRRRRPPT